MKKNVVLVLSGTSNLIAGIAGVIINAEEKSPGFIDDVIVFHDEISESDQLAINKYRKVEFRKFDNILTQTKKTAQSNYFGFLCYGIFEIFDLLNHYHHVIYLDSDVVIKKDFSGIINYGPISILNGGKNIYDCFKSIPPEIKHNFNTKNSGVIVVNDKLNYKGLTKYCYEQTIEQWENNTFADQSMLTYCLFKKGIEVANLPVEYNRLYGRDSSDIIVHCVNSDKKQWNNKIVQKTHHEWRDYYKKWIELGGSEYNGQIHDSFFENINYQSNVDNIVLSRIYLKHMDIILTETNKKLLSLLSDKFIKHHRNKTQPSFYYEFSKNSIVRFELFLYGISIYLKIYTNDEFIKYKIDNEYSKKFNKYQVVKYANNGAALQKRYPLMDHLTKLDALPDLIFKDANEFFKGTLLKESFD